MREKKFAFLLMICIMLCSVSTVFAAESDNYSNYQEFLKSSESSSILEMDSSTYEYIKGILLQEAIPIPADFDNIDYTRIIKVYINTGIEKSEASDKETITNLLENSEYVWVVPFEIGSQNFQVTFGKSRATTKSSEWKITEVALRTVDPYDQFLTSINQAYDYSDIVLIGGIPAFHMPVALAFDEVQAVAWIDMGYSEMAFESLLGESKSRNANNIYDYTTVLNAMNIESNESIVGFGGSSHNNSYTIINKLITFFVAIVLGGSILVFAKLSKRKSKK